MTPKLYSTWRHNDCDNENNKFTVVAVGADTVLVIQDSADNKQPTTWPTAQFLDTHTQIK